MGAGGELAGQPAGASHDTTLTPSRRWLLLAAGALASTLLLVRLCWRGLTAGRRASFATAVRIDLRSASVAELMALPGIGRTRAAAIVLHRVRHGPVRCLEELAEVDGIGPRTLREIAPFVLPRWRSHPDEVDTAPAQAESSARDAARIGPDRRDRPARPGGGPRRPR